VTVTPQPLQKPLPEIRVTATSPDAFATTRRQGLPIFLAVRHEHARMFAPQIATYREARRAAGHPGDGQVFLRAPGYLAATLQAARNDAEVSPLRYYRAQSRRLATMTYDEAVHGSLFTGTPDSVCPQLETLRDELGLNGVLLELNCGGKVPHSRVMEATRLLFHEVQPQFH
jgi:alkanesulfonate monooxygenase SsuD/methylene tetrahydromethanopterin reductase-like flavin-dependent oxidoreductase (luciferase family)